MRQCPTDGGLAIAAATTRHVWNRLAPTGWHATFPGLRTNFTRGAASALPAAAIGTALAAGAVGGAPAWWNADRTLRTRLARPLQRTGPVACGGTDPPTRRTDTHARNAVLVLLARSAVINRLATEAGTEPAVRPRDARTATPAASIVAASLESAIRNTRRTPRAADLAKRDALLVPALLAAVMVECADALLAGASAAGPNIVIQMASVRGRQAPAIQATCQSRIASPALLPTPIRAALSVFTGRFAGRSRNADAGSHTRLV